MTEKQAEQFVDAWVADWRHFLDGGIHWKARKALIVRLAEATKAPAKKRAKADAE